jgi:hypothetical protein
MILKDSTLNNTNDIAINPPRLDIINGFLPLPRDVATEKGKE